MKNCKLSWVLVVVLLTMVIWMGYKFFVGEVGPSEDGRQTVLVSKDERNLLLHEMRGLLEASQGILAAVSKNDFDAVSKLARASGMSVAAAGPESVLRKLPAEMKVLGFDTHRKFDDIAADAEKFRDERRVIEKLSVLMSNCIACHATYRFVEKVQ